MIYFTTFILALFLSQIARAVPQACGDVVPPELPTQVEELLPIPAPTVVTHNKKYDDPHHSTKDTSCPGLYSSHHRFHNFPSFPRLGGAYDIKHTPPFPESPFCGLCWLLTNEKNNHSVVITAIDHAAHGFVVSEEAFKHLHGGPLIPELKHVKFRVVPPSVCGL